MPPEADEEDLVPDEPATMPRWTDYLPVDSLVPDPRNPKRHDEDGLDSSLARFGYTEQVMIDERTGMLVAGHGRRDLVLRARATGSAPPDGIVVDGDGRWLMPVQRGWSSPDDDTAYAYLIGSNRWVERGGWDDELLADGLQALQQAEAGLAGVGYDDHEVGLLLAQLAKRNPEAPAEFRSVDENLPTEHTCPKCGYQFSGNS